MVVMLNRMERMYEPLIPFRTHLEPDSMCVEKVWQFSTLSVPAAGYPKHTRNGRKDVRWQARKQQWKLQAGRCRACHGQDES
jgi:hypothetical protein